MADGVLTRREGAEIDVTTSAAGILAQLDGLSPKNSGEFLDHAGKSWPW